MSYCSRADVEVIYGKDNIAQWADLDNDQEDLAINNRIVATIVIAQAKLDDRLRDGPYAIPFAEPPPTTIVDLTARMTGLLLYTNRGVNDQTGENSLMKTQKDMISHKILQIMAGQIKLPLDQAAVPFPQATHVPLEKPWYKKGIDRTIDASS